MILHFSLQLNFTSKNYRSSYWSKWENLDRSQYPFLLFKDAMLTSEILQLKVWNHYRSPQRTPIFGLEDSAAQEKYQFQCL